MQWKNPDGSLTGGVVIEDGAGNKLGTAANPLNVSGGGGGGGTNASVGSTGAAAPTSATAIGFQNASGNLTTPTPSAGLPVADSGAAITGASMPAGGAGLTGWLSAIWSKLSGTLSVSWSGQSVGVSNKPVGAAALAASQASIGTSASLIVAARTGAVGIGRVSVTIYNSGATTVYFGSSGVTASNGSILPPGASVTLDTTVAVYGVTSSGTNILGVMETF